MTNELDKTRPVQTKEGVPVEIITWSGRGHYPIIGYIGDREFIDKWRKNGTSLFPEADGHDLINVPKKIIRYEVYYYNEHCLDWVHYSSHDSESAAKRYIEKYPQYYKTRIIKVEFET